jgi:capsular exopolysaccharide synthesis family protein
VLFNIEPNGKGLSSVVAGKTGLEEALVRTKIENLSVLPSGAAVSSPAEMIDSESFAAVLKTLAQEYDRILLDSPAVLPVTDAQILATRCDATVLVVRARPSSRRACVQAFDRLVSVDAPILGMVVNDVHAQGDVYGYCPKNGHRHEVEKNEQASRRLVRDAIR